MTEDQTQRVGADQTQRTDEDSTQRVDDELTQRMGDEELTQRLEADVQASALERTQAIKRKRPPASAQDATQVVRDDQQPTPAQGRVQAISWEPAPASAEERTQVVKREQPEASAEARTQAISRKYTQPTPAGTTQPIPAENTQPAPPDFTQPYSPEQTQPMADERTERFSGDLEVAETYVHFGPGVPTAPAVDRAAAIWRGAVAAEGEAGGASTATTVRTSRSEGGQRWILPLTVLIIVVAVVAYFLFGRSSPAVSVTGVSVRASSATLGCSGQETLTGVITTAGGAGTVSYQWVRSDGTKSDVLNQAVSSGDKSVDVTLVWNFDGTGSMRATAVLDVLGPGTPRSASASFDYKCSG